MKTVTSRDGTQIAFDQIGNGPALILVVGAFNDRMTGAPLAQALEQHFTVFTYDRRGRGDSGNTLPYAVEREIEDLEALIKEAGGSAFVFGYSSGAVLSLRAAAQGVAIKKLVLYEAPPTNPESRDMAARLDALIKQGRRGAAVELFQLEVVRIPLEIVTGLRNAPFRPALEKMAHTLVHEMTILTDATMPPALAASVEIPAIFIAGDSSPEMMRQASKSFAEGLPAGQYVSLAGQTHDIVPSVLAPVVAQFLTSVEQPIRTPR